jgi:hypothetical protein
MEEMPKCCYDCKECCCLYVDTSKRPKDCPLAEKVSREEARNIIEDVVMAYKNNYVDITNEALDRLGFTEQEGE